MLGRKRFTIEDFVETRAEPDAVMAMLRDPATWPRWQSEIETTSGPSPLERGDDVNGFARMIGFQVEGRSRTVDVSDRSLVEHAIVGVGMRITYRVERSGSGTRIVRTLDAILPGGLLGKPVAWALRRRLRKMQKKLLAALAQAATTSPDHSRGHSQEK
ncbi:MAG: SRPBCC family protein [Actinomycetota bacterium]|nr:SRPBCC family protein [Actinomycetota bacterium]